MYVSVVFVVRCLYGAVSLTLVREQRFIRITDYYYYVQKYAMESTHGDKSAVSLLREWSRSSSNQILMSCQPHRVTSGQSLRS